MKIQRTAAIVLALGLCTAMRAGASAHAAAVTTPYAATAAQTAADAQQPELPLPDVPSTLREPALRAAYIIEHFWDAMDFSDTRRSHDKAFMEQNFSNFVSVFPYASEDARRKAVNKLMTAAQRDSDAYFLLADIAEKYLWESGSPVKSEASYILFLEHLTSSPLAGDYSALRYRYQLEAARKNRPGDIAADFSYVTRKGRSYMLHSTPVRGQLLVIFYDPDCDHCKEVMESLYDDAVLARAVAAGKLTVVALSIGEDRRQWESAQPLPAKWTDGFVTGDIIETQRYVLRSMPTLYLLDAGMRVILKEASPAEIAEFVGR